MLTRRSFLGGAGAGLISPLLVDHFWKYIENLGEPMLAKAKSPTATLHVDPQTRIIPLGAPGESLSYVPVKKVFDAFDRRNHSHCDVSHRRSDFSHGPERKIACKAWDWILPAGVELTILKLARLNSCGRCRRDLL